ncbi:metal ABC transporter ATP-binding protein [Actinomyces polynesiensis]|uniref:metal ABC transporter ATP-binding protein n=1 Tax=Actinomyces polynesiensis TaxID=1325934 RepID=UPI0005BBF705|nr:ATP-binding cassette domain-containing protein [Actinomyces polynesiensis]
MRELHVRRGDVMALRGVDLDFPAGAVTLLCGGNGSGKSTLLLALAGVLPLHSGRVEGLDGTRPALVPQVPPLPQRLPLSVGAAVAMGRWGGLGLLGRVRRSDREAVGERMRLLGVDALALRQLCEVSGGQRQRALVAQALVREAPVLLLDEPTAAADAASRELIHHAARVEADRGATVVLATHDRGARDVADVVVTLDSGRVSGVEAG